MKATDTTSHGTVLESYANGEVILTGSACVAPDALDLDTRYAIDLSNGLNDWKAMFSFRYS